MNCYLIGVEMAPDGDTKSLVQSIKDYKTWARITNTLYAVVSDQEATEIRDNLARYIGDDGRIFVIKSGVEAAWENARCRNEWLKKNIVRG